MKKTIKVFVLGIIITTLLMSTVLGAGVKKTIEVAFNSINLTINGEKVDADTILYEGTTYVPLRAAGEVLNKEIGWDQKTSTASINDKISKTDNANKGDLHKLKLFAEISNHYNTLTNLGLMIKQSENNLYESAYDIENYNNLGSLYTYEDFLNKGIMVEFYYELLASTKLVVKNAKTEGIDISNMNAILEEYSNSIDYYKMSFGSLKSYALTNTQSTFVSHTVYRNMATEMLNEAIVNSMDGYDKFIWKIIGK